MVNRQELARCQDLDQATEHNVTCLLGALETPYFWFRDQVLIQNM